MTHLVTSFPAAGFTVLWFDEDAIYDREPIIGFMVLKEPPDLSDQDDDTAIVPVTARHVVRGRFALLLPDGRVQRGEVVFASLEEFEQHLRDRRAKAKPRGAPMREWAMEQKES